jgi:Cdc6-like AAA superfamily ATPase
VSWEPLTEEEATSSGSVPLPARLAHRPGVGVLGREEELARLSDTAKRVATGQGREVLLIAGEPGQGKTPSSLRSPAKRTRTG